MARRRPGRLLTVLGVLVVLVGLLGGAVLALAAGERRSNAVEGLARAPVGCDTTLDFAESGEYLVFVERAGTIGAVRGDCDVDETYSADGPIDVVITVVDPDGDDVALDDDVDSISYDVDGFVGSAAFVLDVTEPGDHVMRVESGGDPFVVAVGTDPSDGLVALFAGAVAAALVGLLVGVAMIVSGRSRARRSLVTSATPPPYAPSFTPVGQVPQGPPTYTQPGGPVQYGQPAPTAAPPPPAFGQAPPPPVAPSASPVGVPPYQAPPSPPSFTPPAAPSVPQIPGEPTWVAPGDQPAPPVAVPTPPEAAAPHPWNDGSQPAVADPDPMVIPPASTPADEATLAQGHPAVDDETTWRDRGDVDDTPTIERPRWDGPPPPS